MVHCCSCKIGPSVLASDLSNLCHESHKVMDCGADYLHLDVMDGYVSAIAVKLDTTQAKTSMRSKTYIHWAHSHFVPNITFGAPVIKCLRKNTPNAFFEDPIALIKMIKAAGMKAGVAVKPGTDIKLVDSLVSEVAMVLVMTVEPGFGGQKFMADMMPKVEYVRAKYPTMDIEVDGGLGPATIDTAAKAGANMIVAGSSVFQAEDTRAAIEVLRKSVNKYGLGIE